MNSATPYSGLTVAGRFRSIRNAVRGVVAMLATQHNAWLHAGATVIVIALGFVFGLTRLDWCVIVLAIVAVWTAEALNTALEFLAGVASPDFHPLVEKAKDVAAGGVLITAAGAAVIGIIIFGSYIVV